MKYAFGAGNLKLGDRVEIKTSEMRGILVSESVHLSGCNTYGVQVTYGAGAELSGDKKVKHIDYLLLRKLELSESAYDPDKVLTDENSACVKRVDPVDAALIEETIKSGKELIPEVDDPVTPCEIAIVPGTRVFVKPHGVTGIVTGVYRRIFDGELTYCVDTYGRNAASYSFPANALIPLELKVDVYPAAKSGPAFEEHRRYPAIMEGDFDERCTG